MSFIPGKQGKYNISSVGYGDAATANAVDKIYFGSPFNLSVIVFKAFISAIQYEMGKDISEENNVAQNYHSFSSYNGNFAIKLSFDVPSSTSTEAKNNLAKISHLQNMIMPARTLGKSNTLKQHVLVYFSNMINNGAMTKSNYNPTNYVQLKSKGLYTWISDIKYTPDFSQGHYETSDGVFPKYYKVDLTLNPDTEFRREGRMFLHPFNQNGQYSSQDSVFFPFKIPCGTYNLESSNFSQSLFPQFSKSEFIEMDKDCSRTINNSKKSYVYISLPVDKPLESLPRSDNGGLTRRQPKDSSNKVRRQIAFKPFLKSFERNMAAGVDVKSDPGAKLEQYLNSYQTHKPIEYSFSLDVPSSSLSEAKRNAAKIQFLMRMFFSRENIGNTLETKELYSLRVFIPSFLGKSTKKLGRTGAYDNSYILQVKNISINIDSSFGYFRDGVNLFPKVYEVKFDFVDTHQENQRKITRQGTLESLGSTTQELRETVMNPDGTPKLDSSGFPITRVIGTRTVSDESFDHSLSNIKDSNDTSYFSSGIKYWNPGE